MKIAVLGLDTSCYTTSCALADKTGILASERRLLEVEPGRRGLQQSQAVFQHIHRLPELLEALFARVGEVRVAGVIASSRPRDVEGSYMPVFVSGFSFARSIAAALGVPLYQTSHQQGHIRAAMVDSGLQEKEFLALHLSGGTTEVLRVSGEQKVELLGGSSDLHTGQLVDRVGVRMGLQFPAGPELERLARGGQAQSRMPLSHKKTEISFSGAEAQAMRMLESGESREDVAAEVYSYLTRAVAWMISMGYERTRLPSALISGGVASSALLRERLPERLGRLGCPVRLHFGRPEYSGDNACGVALIGWEKHARS